MKLLGKKGKDDPLLLAYEKCKVYMCMCMFVSLVVRNVQFTSIATCLCLVQHFSPTLQATDKPEDLTRRATHLAPRFVQFGETQYFIYVGGVILCDVSSFSKAVCLWFVTHHVFNLEYGKPLRGVPVLSRVYLQAPAEM